jgi:hypothetical protein
VDHDVARSKGNASTSQKRGHIGAGRIEAADNTKDATDDKPASCRFLEP